MKKVRKALVITEEAKDNTFDDCTIVGGVEIAGKRTKFVRTKILDYKNQHPIIALIGFAASLITVGVFIYNLF